MERPSYYGNPAGLTGEVEIVRAIYAAFADRDLDRALTFIDPTCEIHLAGTASEVGRAAPYVGHDGLREYFADVGRVWDRLEIHADDFRTVPGSVIVMGWVLGTREGETRRRACVWTWRLRQGVAVYLRMADLGRMAD
jgi:ketosteroid isomerase-like protein